MMRIFVSCLLALVASMGGVANAAPITGVLDNFNESRSAALSVDESFEFLNVNPGGIHSAFSGQTLSGRNQGTGGLFEIDVGGGKMLITSTGDGSGYVSMHYDAGMAPFSFEGVSFSITNNSAPGTDDALLFLSRDHATILLATLFVPVGTWDFTEFFDEQLMDSNSSFAFEVSVPVNSDLVLSPLRFIRSDVSVPAPSTGVMMALGIVALVFARRSFTTLQRG